MTLLDWRRNPERLALAMDLLRNYTMSEMLGVLEVEHPARSQHAIIDGFGATRVLGQIEGFQAALDMLRSFAEPLPSAPEEVPTTWGVNVEDPLKPS